MKFHVQDFVDCKDLIKELLNFNELSVIDNYSNSLELAIQSKIVKLNNNKTKISIENKIIVQKLVDIEIDMYIVENYLKNVDPDWIHFVQKGFKEVESYAPERMKLVFKNLNLFDISDKRVEKWWLSLKTINRSSNYRRLKEIGSEGEEIILNYEKKRVNRMPLRVSLESDYYGYDILSYESANSDKKIRIEVKNCESNNLHFFLTRNEYENSKSSNYFFYFIDSRNIKSRILYIFKNNLIMNDISKDRGSGLWSTIEISMNSDKLDKCEKIILH